MSGMEIDWETVDLITKQNLESQLEYLEQEIHDHVHKGKWMHPEDYHNSCVNLIPAFKTLIKYYGG